MERPPTRDGKAENKADGGGFDNRAESIMEVNTGTLVETFGNKTGLVAINGTVRVAFDAKNPFASNGGMSGRRRNEIPSTILEESIKLCTQSVTPVGGTKGLSDSRGFSVRRREGSERVFLNGFEDSIFTTGGHGMSGKRERMKGGRVGLWVGFWSRVGVKRWVGYRKWVGGWSWSGWGRERRVGARDRVGRSLRVERDGLCRWVGCGCGVRVGWRESGRVWLRRSGR